MIGTTWSVAVLTSMLMAETAPAAVKPVVVRTVAVPTTVAAREADADAWAARTEAQLTDAERFSPIHGFMALPFGPDADTVRAKWPADVIPGAGYMPGVPRLGIPSLRETDASLGVTNPFGIRPGDGAAVRNGVGCDLRSDTGPYSWCAGRQRSPGQGVQRTARRRHEPDARSA